MEQRFASTTALVLVLCAIACAGCSRRDHNTSTPATRPASVRLPATRPAATQPFADTPPTATEPAESPVPRAVTRLLGLLKADDPTVRFETAIAIGRLGEPEAIWPLIETGAGDPNRGVRIAAVTAVALLGERNTSADEAEKSMAFLTLVIPKLDLDVFKPQDMSDIVARHANDTGHVHQINYQAFQATGALEGVPLKARWRNITMGEAVCRMLVATGSKVGFTIWGGCIYITPAEDIINGIHFSRRERHRRAVLQQWSSQSDAGRQTLKKLAKEISKLSFAEIDLRDVIQFLREYSEVNIRVDWEVLLASGIEPTTKVSTNERNVTVEKVVALILQDLGSAPTDDGRFDYLVDDDVLFISTRKAIERRIAARPGPVPKLMPTPAEEQHKAMGWLIAALKDKDPLVRQSVAATLGRIGAGYAADLLAGMAKSDGDPSVRKAAAEAVLRLRGMPP